MSSTVAAYELLWTVVGLIGTLTSFGVVTAGLRDLLAPDTQRDRTLRAVAILNLLVANGIGVVLTVFAVVGARAMALPSATRDGAPELASVLVGLAFIGSELILTAIPISVLWMRRHVWQIAEAEGQDRDWDGRTERRREA